MLEEQAQAVAAIGGSAQIIGFDATGPAQQAELERLFDRSGDYGALLAKLDALKAGFARVDEIEARRQLAAVRREAEALVAIDYFPGAARLQLEQALADAEALANLHFSPDEPHAASGHVERCDLAEFQGRLWATRRRLWVDRVASAWLIRRFIDPGARFLWLEDPQDCPPSAIGFDFDGARFSHVGPRVTFEVLVASFALDRDENLVRLGALVHYLDVGGISVPEASGFTAILTGARAQAPDDDALLATMSVVLDSLYASYGQPDRSVASRIRSDKPIPA